MKCHGENLLTKAFPCCISVIVIRNRRNIQIIDALTGRGRLRCCHVVAFWRTDAMKTTSFSGKICRRALVCALLLAVAILSGCTHIKQQLGQEPENAAPKTNTAPTLLTLSTSTNPKKSSKTLLLTAKYEDLEADLQQGLAAVSINGTEPLTIAFRTVYPSGLLTLSIPITS